MIERYCSLSVCISIFIFLPFLLVALQDASQPIMCAYKLVTCEFKWFGLQGTVESRIQKAYPRLFRNFHRQVFCWLDQWYGLTIDDIRRLEEQTKKELDEVCFSHVQKRCGFSSCTVKSRLDAMVSDRDKKYPCRKPSSVVAAYHGLVRFLDCSPQWSKHVCSL